MKTLNLRIPYQSLKITEWAFIVCGLTSVVHYFRGDALSALFFVLLASLFVSGKGLR